MSALINLSGFKSGRLTVITRSGTHILSGGSTKPTWLCVCECGTEFSAGGDKIRRGHVRSCGCLHADFVATLKKSHGMAGSPIYGVWSGMIARCTYPRSTGYEYYGARGISVCERWLKFENFYADMGPRPSRKHSIDRKDNDGNYEPSNCRWATRQEQNANRRSWGACK